MNRETSGTTSGGYATELGLRLEQSGAGEVRMALQYSEGNALGKSMHGGVLASALSEAAEHLVRSAQSAWRAPLVAGAQITYVRPMTAGPAVVTSRALRGARDVLLVEGAVLDGAGAPLAMMQATLREGRSSPPPCEPMGAELGGDAALLEQHMQQIPFAARHGVHVASVGPGAVRLGLDRRGGFSPEEGIPQGFLLALIDMAGSTCPWTLALARNTGGATVSLQANIFATASSEELCVEARALTSEERLVWSDVRVRGITTGVLLARGSVFYRFTVAEKGS